MKKLLLSLACIALAFFAVSCLHNFDQKHTGGETPTIPFDFEWGTTRDVALTVGMPTVGRSEPEFALVNIYSSPVLQGDNLLWQDMLSHTRRSLDATFTLPVGVENLYVQMVAPDGSRAVRMVPVQGEKTNVSGMRVKQAPSAAGRALVAEMIAAAAQTRKVSSMSIPVTEQVPVSFDMTIDKTPQSQLSIGGDASKSSYLIPSGVRVNGNIDLVGWTNNRPTLYIAGTLELKGKTNVERTRLVVLEGGKVTLHAGLTINNVFEDQASVYVFDGGELTVQSLDFAHGKNGILVNEGSLNITDGKKEGHLKMAGGKLYTTTGINVDYPDVAITVLPSSYAEIHNDGVWSGEDLQMDALSVFANYENGVVTVNDVKMDQSTINQYGVFTAQDVRFSSRMTLNNNCQTTIGEFDAWAQSEINLAAGSLLSVTGSLNLQSSVVNLASMSMLDIAKLDKLSYGGSFVGPEVSANVDGAQALVRIEVSEYKDNWNPMSASGALEIVTEDPDGLKCGAGATIVTEQTVDITASECNGGAGSITPTPEGPQEEFKNLGMVFSYCFEDCWPWCGDYDMNDLVLVSSVDRRVKNGLVEAIRINWEARASGADNTIALAVGLNKVLTSNIASVVASHTISEGAFAVEGGLEQENDYAVIPLFNTVGEVLGRDNTYTNTEVGAIKVEVQKHTTIVTFTTPVTTDALTESAIDVFLVVSRSDAEAPERWREIHLPTYQPTDHAMVANFNTVIPDMPYKYYAQAGDLSNNGLMWGLCIPGEFAYPSEMNDIRFVYTEFTEWAQSGGMMYPTWYEGDVVSEKIYR